MEFVIGAAAFAAAVLLAFGLVRIVARGLFGRRRRLEASMARDVLEHRLARGEISREAFDAALAGIGDG